MRNRHWNQAGKLSAILIAAAALSACSSDDDTKRLKETHVEPPSENCEFGGEVHVSGEDLNGDGVLSADEIDGREYDCKPDPGTGETDGTERLTETYAEPAGENCEFGGDRIVTGIDKDKDGSLSFSEIDGTTYECADDPNQPEGERLTELRTIGSTPDCVNGGQEIISGIDVDESGDLQEEEIDARTYNCAGELPGGMLIDIEVLPVGDATCADGGKIIHSGLDTDEDGVLQVSEREDAVTLCAPPEGTCDGVAGLSVRSAVLSADVTYSYSEGSTYPILVRLSRELDAGSLQVIQFDEAFAADADFSATQSEPDLITSDWIAENGSQREGTLMIADACGLSFATIALPIVNGPITAVYPEVEYKEYAVGDDYEFCWTSRHADACEFRTTNGDPNPVALPTEGCHTFMLEPHHFSNGFITGMSLSCGKTGGYQMLGNINQPTTPMIMNYGIHGNTVFPSTGGLLQLTWAGAHVDNCEVVTPDGRVPAPTVTDEIFTVPVTSSGFVSVECLDAADEVVRAGYSSPIVVGAGITSFHASIYEDNGDARWGYGINTYFLDGTCDVTATRGDFTIEQTDLVMQQGYNQPPYQRIHNENNGVTPGEGHLFVQEDKVYAEVVCRNADGSNETTLTYEQ